MEPRFLSDDEDIGLPVQLFVVSARKVQLFAYGGYRYLLLPNCPKIVGPKIAALTTFRDEGSPMDEDHHIFC